jgi:23S rRNA (adenine2030-N6)-methyltransferase
VNYRHSYHAGNFADVMKHVLLRRLLLALQGKEKGFLYLDTHAGRGGYDLERAATGETLARQPEWPDGIGRLWDREALPPGVADYIDLVRDFDRRQGNPGRTVRFYPGSPWLARSLARPQDRLVLCERQPAECAALRAAFQGALRTSVHEVDGYTALRAMLPAPERRALVLIDPPFEAPDEFTALAAALREGLRRQSTAVFAVWYPLTERARRDEFFAGLRGLEPPRCVAAELAVAGDDSPLRMKGCGLLIVNPPWRFADEIEPVLAFLASVLAQAPGGGSGIRWLVPAR